MDSESSVSFPLINVVEQLESIIELRIDWSDMDMFGHVNNIAFFKYIQSSRVHNWEITGLSADFEIKRIGPILVSCQCNFIKPLHYPGSVEVIAKVSFIKNTSFGLHHTLWGADGNCVAEANDVMVMYNFNTLEKVPLPVEFCKQWRSIHGAL